MHKLLTSVTLSTLSKCYFVYQTLQYCSFPFHHANMPILLLKIFIGLQSHYPPTQIKGKKKTNMNIRNSSQSPLEFINYYVLKCQLRETGRIFGLLFKTFLYFKWMFSSLQILKLKSCYQVLESKPLYIKTKARHHEERKKTSHVPHGLKAGFQ